VHSVVIPDTGGLQHANRVVRDGTVLATFSSLAAVDDWRLRHTGSDADTPESGR